MQNPQKPFTESGSSPPLTVTLSRINLVPGCTVATGVGLDAGGNEATFGCDWRPALALAEAVEAGEAIEVALPGWQALSIRRAAP